MADSSDNTIDVNIWNDARTKAVTVSTDGAKERLDVNALISGGSSRPPRTKIYEFTGSQTNVIILTPASGKKIDVFFISLVSDDTSGSKVTVDFATSVIRVFVDWTKTGGSPAQLSNHQGAINEVLTLNVTGLAGSKQAALYIGYDEI